MGSPADEKDREPWAGKETQHLVTLSHGFWLADTACTQALWEAVMGDNPAYFNDNPQNPVETVSWLDIQIFLQRLNQQYPDLQAQLPSEAQWEYACRAGTTTPFSFGDTITPEQVNYDGTQPYAGAKKGEFRDKTVSVKTLAKNPWGLYEMHGNVWEWCVDEWSEQLGTEPVLDPVNTRLQPDEDEDEGEGVQRVLRGGSWIYGGWNCRSAARNRRTADSRNGRFGFRLSLGH